MTLSINASEGTVRATAAAIARAALFDDRITAGDPARIAAWSEALEPFSFDQSHLLAGVTKHYQAKDAPTIKVGDLIAEAKQVRKDQAERETAEERRRRENEQDARLGLTPPDTGFGNLPINRDGKPVWDAYAINGAIDIKCPHCQSAPGEACWNPITRKDRKIPCLKRINHAKHTA